MFEPGPGDQLHDFNPSAPRPTGLFWTVPILGSGISLDMDGGRATLSADNVPVLDHGQIPNAISGMGPPPQPATVSFQVEWSGGTNRVPVMNSEQGFAGQFIRNSAMMEWSATVGQYQLKSAPLATSSSSFAEIGLERNGFFFG